MRRLCPKPWRLTSGPVASLLILGAGYIGAAIASHAAERGETWCWPTTGTPPTARRWRASPGEVRTADIRVRSDLDALLAGPFDVSTCRPRRRAGRCRADPEYTEQTTWWACATSGGVLADVPLLVYASSLHVYGRGRPATSAPTALRRQGDLAHLSKIYAELCLACTRAARASAWP